MSNVELFNALLAVASIVLTVYFGMRQRKKQSRRVELRSTSAANAFPCCGSLFAEASDHRVRVATS